VDGNTFYACSFFRKMVDYYILTTKNGGNMTLHDRLQIRVKCAELKKLGKDDEALKLSMTIPMEPWLAEWNKKYIGADYLRNSGWNLSDAEAAFGHNWLDT
jgi:hypothetical protein